MHDNLSLKHSVRLLAWSGFFGMWPYIPRLGYMLSAPKDDLTVQMSNKILRFKQSGKHSDEIKLLIMAIAGHFECDAVLAVPPSEPDKQPNSLQKIFGRKINRIKPVETRKYNHNKSLPVDYASSYDISENCRRPLIVDDVLRTGSTLKHFVSRLGGLGLAVGLYYKLRYVPGNSIHIYEATQSTGTGLIQFQGEDLSLINIDKYKY